MNLFLSESGTVKLGCYGLTTQAEYYSEEKAKCEGIRSFAPEVFEGKYELKSDVWSLGLALMRLARVEPLPEDDDDLPEIVGSYYFPFGELKGFSDAFVDFVKKCLVKEVNERWSMDVLMNVSCFSAV